MAERACKLCKCLIDDAATVCPYCDEKQYGSTPSLGSNLPWPLIGGVAVACVLIIFAGSSWSSANRTTTDPAAQTSGIADSRKFALSSEEASRLTAQVRRRLADDLKGWEKAVDLGSIRVNTSGVLELTARVKSNDPGRRVANFLAGLVSSSIGGRFKVSGFVISSSDGEPLVSRANNAPMPHQ